jgi:hypothetical protein
MRPEADSHRQEEPSSEKATTSTTAAPPEVPRPPRPIAFWIVRSCIFAALAILLSLTSLWALFALYFDGSIRLLKIALPCLYLVTILAIWITLRRRRLIATGLTLGCFAIVCAWWLLIPPSNARDWQPDVAITPFAEIEGNRVKIHNIRNCRYQTETDFDVDHYDRSFDLDAIRAVDLYVVYWGSPLVAHTMASFDFGRDDYVCISIETRKEKRESYSALRGFFRQYELVYVIADERDLVRLRTNFRNEQVYLYRTRLSPDAARALFLDYVQTATELHKKPRWYNALTDNCTTNIRVHSQHAQGRRTPLDWRVIVNGYADQMLYERGSIDTSLPFDELKRRSLINPRARHASETNFSGEIRRNLPGLRE